MYLKIPTGDVVKGTFQQTLDYHESDRNIDIFS
jgi:hypothetical protein